MSVMGGLLSGKDRVTARVEVFQEDRVEGLGFRRMRLRRWYGGRVEVVVPLLAKYLMHNRCERPLGESAERRSLTGRESRMVQ